MHEGIRVLLEKEQIKDKRKLKHVIKKKLILSAMDYSYFFLM